MNNERKIANKKPVFHLIITGDGAFADLLNSEHYVSNLHQLAKQARDQVAESLMNIRQQTAQTQTYTLLTKSKMLLTMLRHYYDTQKKLRSLGFDRAAFPMVIGYNEGNTPTNDTVLRDYMTRREQKNFGDNTELANFIASVRPNQLFGENLENELLPEKAKQYIKVCRYIGAKRPPVDSGIKSLMTQGDCRTVYELLQSGRTKVGGGLIFARSDSHSDNENLSTSEAIDMNRMSLASAMIMSDAKSGKENPISDRLGITHSTAWNAIIETLEQQQIDMELLVQAKKPLGGLCSLVYTPNYSVPFSDAVGLCGDHKLKNNLQSVQNQEKEVCPCAGFLENCKFRQNGKQCPSEGNICRWSKLYYTATKFKLHGVMSVLQQAHDKMCTAVYIFLVFNEEFKQCLIKLAFFSEVLYLDAIGDVWSAFCLPELSKFERLARAFKGVVFFHSIIGEQLYTPRILKSGVLSDTDPWLGVTMNNIWEMFANLCSFLKMHISDDGESWIRLESVSKMYSNDLVEEFHSLVTNLTGDYKARTPDFDAIAASVDTIILIRMSNERRHVTWLSKNKKYNPADASPHAVALYNKSNSNSKYTDVVKSKYYKACFKRTLREINGKYKSIRDQYKVYSSAKDPADALPLKGL